jgi:hypothetical protein
MRIQITPPPTNLLPYSNLPDPSATNAANLPLLNQATVPIGGENENPNYRIRSHHFTVTEKLTGPSVDVVAEIVTLPVFEPQV